MVLLFLPKLLSIILIWCKGSKEYGGFFRVTLSLLLEVLFSVLLAPVRMLFHTVFVVSAFLGWEVVWNSPQRDDDSTPWSEAFMRHGSQLLLGLVWAAGWPGSALPVLAGADCLLADPVAVCLCDLQPFNGGTAYQTLEAVPDPGRVFPAAGAGGYRYLSGAEPQSHAG
jgi:membrane glycosyltransferase